MTAAGLGAEELGALVAAEAPGPLEASVFGTTDPQEISARLDDLTRALFGRPIRHALWYRRSVAAVAGVVLGDGRPVAIRAYQPSVRSSFIEAVVRVQHEIASATGLAPRPLGDPVALEWGLGRAEELVEDEGARRPPQSAMAASAAALARVTEAGAAADASGLDQHPMASRDDRLYPVPHSPLFDFEATADGAHWIDEIAMAAKPVARADDDTAVTHGDWSARNVRYGPAGVTHAYDWESLQLTAESTGVGIAAATWNALGEAGEPPAPGPDDVVRYVECYGRIRPLGAVARKAAIAMAIYGLAYTARCEHALEPGTRTARAASTLHAHRGELLALLDKGA